MAEAFNETGTVDSLIYRSDPTGFVVFLLRYHDGSRSVRISVAGNTPVQKGQKVTVSGTVGTFKNKRQVKAESIEVLKGTDSVALLRKVCEEDVPGIGPVRAKTLIDAFGLDALIIAEQDPARVADLPGWSRELADRLCAHQARMSKRVTGGFLAGLGLSYEARQELHTLYGSSAESRVRENPFAALAGLPRVTFRMIDEIAGRLGVDAADPRRIEAGCIEAAKDLIDKNGDTALASSAVIGRAKFLLRTPAVGDAAFEEGLSAAIGKGALARLPNTYDLVSLSEIAAAEDTIARTFMCSAPTDPRVLLQACNGPCRAGVVDVGALPSANAMESLSDLLAPAKNNIILLAPAPHHVELPPALEGMEIHPVWAWRGEQKQSSAARLIVCLDAHVLDVVQMGRLCDALGPNDRLLLAGSSAELPPTGAGFPFRDLVDAETVALHSLAAGPCGQIAQLAKGIEARQDIALSQYPAAAKAFCVALQGATDLSEQTNAIIHGARRFNSNEFPEHGIPQVLTATGRGPLGTHALNRELQRLFANAKEVGVPAGFKDAECTLYAGDRVITTATKNPGGIPKGAIGIVRSIEAGKARIVAGGAEATFEAEDLRWVNLAYAITVRRAQGMTFDKVLMVGVTPPWQETRSRYLVTGLRTAKYRLLLITDNLALSEEDRQYERRTGLPIRLTPPSDDVDTIVL